MPDEILGLPRVVGVSLPQHADKHCPKYPSSSQWGLLPDVEEASWLEVHEQV
jgi:hypothetical protein